MATPWAEHELWTKTVYKSKIGIKLISLVRRAVKADESASIAAGCTAGDHEAKTADYWRRYAALFYANERVVDIQQVPAIFEGISKEVLEMENAVEELSAASASARTPITTEKGSRSVEVLPAFKRSRTEAASGDLSADEEDDGEDEGSSSGASAKFKSSTMSCGSKIPYRLPKAPALGACFHITHAFSFCCTPCMLAPR